MITQSSWIFLGWRWSVLWQTELRTTDIYVKHFTWPIEYNKSSSILATESDFLSLKIYSCQVYLSFNVHECCLVIDIRKNTELGPLLFIQWVSQEATKVVNYAQNSIKRRKLVNDQNILPKEWLISCSRRLKSPDLMHIMLRVYS